MALTVPETYYQIDCEQKMERTADSWCKGPSKKLGAFQQLLDFMPNMSLFLFHRVWKMIVFAQLRVNEVKFIN